MVVRTSLGGARVRVRLMNAFGASSVAIGAARIAKSTGGATIDVATSRPLTFSGRKTATLYAGQILVSDPVDLAVAPLSDIAVTIYLPGETGPPTQHLFGLRSTYISSTGDFTEAPDIKEPATTTQSYYWLAGLDVVASPAAGTIVTFGDSITDGDQSTPEKLASWPSALAARLQATGATSNLAVVNAGISGNRLLGDDGGGLVRLQRDGLSEPGVRWITLLEGINDITSGVRQQHATGLADDLIAAYKQVVEQAHARGIRVAGCTLTPFGDRARSPRKGSGSALPSTTGFAPATASTRSSTSTRRSAILTTRFASGPKPIRRTCCTRATPATSSWRTPSIFAFSTVSPVTRPVTRA